MTATKAADAAHQTLGEMMTILMRSTQYRQMPLYQLETLIKPALLTGQFLIARATPKNKETSIPIALAIWASVSDEVDKRLSAQENARSMRLKSEEWKSGDNPWIIAVAGDKRAAPLLIKQLRDAHFKGKKIKTFVMDKGGKPKLGEIGEPAASAQAH